MSHAGVLVLALILDAGLGEPRWLWSRLPHPAVLMGRAVGWAEERYNHGENRRQKGAAVFAALALAAVALGWVLGAIPGGTLVEIALVAVLLAQRSLADHVRAVGDALRLSLGDGRRAVARIVGRDTAGLNRSAVARGAIESAAENFSDGVVAPVFWFLLAGLPGLMLYKLTNTADSMIGYRNDRYHDFGWATARFDDAMNWIPARLSAGLILLLHGRAVLWQMVRRDARLHRSPNAGWPEAAMAGVLGVAVAGARSYHGEMRDFPFVNPEGRRTLTAGDIDAAVAVLWRSWWGILAFTVLIAVA